MAETDRRPLPTDVPRPTSGRENNKAFIYAVCGAGLVLAIVLAFNFAGPPGPGRNVDLTNPSPAGAPTEQSSPTAPSAPPSTSGSTDTVAPQRGDTPASPGREGVGAPVGGSAPAPVQTPSPNASAPGTGSAPAGTASAAQ